LGVALAQSRAGSLSLVGGILALDFANTASGRGTAHPVEHFQCPGDLVAWAAHARSIDAATAGRCCALLRRTRASKFLRDALRLRETVYQIGSALARDQAPSPTDLATLKEFAQRSIAQAKLAPVAGGGYAFDFSAGPVESALLGPPAWSAIELLATGASERIKQCPGHDCGWLFFDNSKNNSRRWCDMAVCGNRSKAKAHRARTSASCQPG
jgi:predicted RNA-binding Zn ribbon-like protein